MRTTCARSPTERRWPKSTRQISELRLVIDYQSRYGAPNTLTLDIVDYPGEWLLDLPLLTKSYPAMVGGEPDPVAPGDRARHLRPPGTHTSRRLIPTEPEDEQAALRVGRSSSPRICGPAGTSATP